MSSDAQPFPAPRVATDVVGRAGPAWETFPAPPADAPAPADADAAAEIPSDVTASVGRYVRPRRGPWLQVGGPRVIEWNRATLPVPGWPAALSGLRVLHLTDLHLTRRWPPALDAVCRRTRDDPPDAILFTGDFVDDKYDHRQAVEHVGRFLNGLRSRLGTFAVLGNHDGDLLAPRLAEWPVTHAGGKTLEITDASRGGAAFELVGTPGAFRDDVNEAFYRSVPPKRPGIPRLLMAHTPDAILACRATRPDVVLAGHTHGGQVCLPTGCPLITHDALDPEYSKGVHRLHDAWLVVGRGMGYSTYPVRTFCPAEVIEVTLVPAG